MARKPTPYEGATSGLKARQEITDMLRRFGCEQVGFGDDFEAGRVILTFLHRGRPVRLEASAKGWAQLWMRNSGSEKLTGRKRADAETRAIRQGGIAVNSILRDWVKGQITAVECGAMSFEAVFMPYMITKDGRLMAEVMASQKNLLPPPTH